MRRLLSAILLFILSNLLFGGRYYDAATGRFLQVDPLASKYPSLSPYNYALNNPLMFIDPNGKEVYFHGEDAEEASKRLNSSTSLEVTYDSETGQITATGEAETDADKMLLEAINNPDVIVNLTTVSGGFVQSIDGSTQPLIVGLFDGSSIDSDDKVKTSQFINLEHAQKWEEVGGGTVGQSVLHETNESYIGGLQNPGVLYSSENFNKAHNATTAIDPPQGQVKVDIVGKDKAGNIVVKLTGSKGTAYIRLKQ